jgi:hypothetical protein
MALLVSVGAASFSTKDTQCSSLVVRTDKDAYTTGQVVNVSVDYVHLLPGCFEFMIAHDYVIKVEILNSSNMTEYSHSNATAGNLVMHLSWKAAQEGEYTVKASSWLRLAGDESTVKQLEDSVVIRVQDPTEGTTVLAPEFDLATVGALTIVAVTLVLALTRHGRRNEGSIK